jgi:predicted metal-dependent hydrolase
MEAATPLPFSQVRTQGARLWIDGLVVDDACAVRLAREREQAGEDVARLVADAIAIGARVLDREQTGANADFVKAEFEKAARELDASFVERARLVAERLDARIDDVFGPENGHLTKALARHFGDESSVAVQNRVKALLSEVGVQMREDLRRQFSSDGDNNPLATFQRMAISAMRDSAQAQTAQLKAMDEKLGGLREEVVKLQAEKEKLAEVAAEVQRGTAKGRSYEEEVAAAIDALALPLGDDCEAVGDLKEATGKKGDIVVSIGAGHGLPQGRVVFEAKNSRLSRPEAIRQLEDARAERNADYAVLVVPSEDKVPARMHALREYNGDKLVVAYDAEEGPLALQVAYSLARARVLMARGGSDGVDGAAVVDTVERAVGALEEVRRVRQQLTGAKTQIDKASEIVGAMSDRVRAHLEEIAELVRVAEDGGEPAAQDGAERS